jgi:hypothetical protein
MLPTGSFQISVSKVGWRHNVKATAPHPEFDSSQARWRFTASLVLLRKNHLTVPLAGRKARRSEDYPEILRNRHFVAGVRRAALEPAAASNSLS